MTRSVGYGNKHRKKNNCLVWLDKSCRPNSLDLFYLVCVLVYSVSYYVQGTVDLVATLILASGCAYVFGQINLVAGLIFIPYICWMMSFVGYLCAFPLFVGLIMHLFGTNK